MNAKDWFAPSLLAAFISLTLLVTVFFWNDVRADVNDVRSDLSRLEANVADLQVDVAVLKSDMAYVKNDIAEIKAILQGQQQAANR